MARVCALAGCSSPCLPGVDVCSVEHGRLILGARQSKLPTLGRLPGAEFDLEPDTAQTGSPLETRLLSQMRRRGLPDPIMEYMFHPDRGWKADFAFPALRILIEVEGGLWMKGGGRHNRAQGYEKDLEKYNAASIAGWILLRYSGDMVKSGEAIQEIATVVEWKQRSAAAG